MDSREFKADLIERVRFQAEWRDEKAAEYPEDERNQESARILRSLADRLSREVPYDSPALIRLWNVWYGLRRQRQDPMGHEMIPLVEAEQGVLRSWGFHAGGDDPFEFLESMASDLESPDR